MSTCRTAGSSLATAGERPSRLDSSASPLPRRPQGDRLPHCRNRQIGRANDRVPARHVRCFAVGSGRTPKASHDEPVRNDAVAGEARHVVASPRRARLARPRVPAAPPSVRPRTARSRAAWPTVVTPRRPLRRGARSRRTASAAAARQPRAEGRTREDEHRRRPARACEREDVLG